MKSKILTVRRSSRARWTNFFSRRPNSSEDLRATSTAACTSSSVSMLPNNSLLRALDCELGRGGCAASVIIAVYLLRV
jgi:hypothetical protein